MGRVIDFFPESIRKAKAACKSTSKAALDVEKASILEALHKNHLTALQRSTALIIPHARGDYLTMLQEDLADTTQRLESSTRACEAALEALRVANEKHDAAVANLADLKRSHEEFKRFC